MKRNPERLAQEYYNVKTQLIKLEFRRKNLRNSLFEIFEETKNNEVVSGDILVYRKKVWKVTWNHDILKPILQQEGLWEKAISPDPKKIRKLLINGSLSYQKIKEAEINNYSWYTYTDKIS
jgi:hypothetical protein